ncbi:MAG: M20 family metallopeptidase [Anaerolineae bacterium]|jgi:amidohydrolase|nr:M20 family metallopeptidase [Anaerolineae bacterium]
MKALEQANDIFDQLVTWRRDFHLHPELGLETFRTAGIVAGVLRELGYTVQEGVARSGVIGLMENGEGPVIMSRVDMDALPILEENLTSYASKIPGRMHACGHDAHTAIGLGIAMIMAQHRDTWQGTLKLIFQPGEEGQNGAEIMVQEGALDNPRPQVALALHIWNHMPFGKISAAPGPVMAAAEAFKVTVSGRGGHGALPEKTIDAVIIAALMVTNLQTIISRNIGALETAVLTIGSIQSGDAFNVIPETAELRGTIRTYDPLVRARVLDRLQAIVHGTAEMMGATADLQMMPVTPALVNDRSVTALVQDVARDLFGSESLDTSERTMGSEDAAFFLQEVPGCYVFVASGPEDFGTRPHHSPRFDIDERVLANGVGLIVETLHRLMPVRAA